ncbi:hypothetical protein, partial [uncultured Muribaculum sp.]
HSLALFFISFGHDGAPSLPQELKKITQQLTALPLTFIVEPALNNRCYFYIFLQNSLVLAMKIACM